MKKVDKIIFVILLVIGSLFLFLALIGKIEHWAVSFRIKLAVCGFVLQFVAVGIAILKSKKKNTGKLKS